jgi:transposase
MEMAIHDEDLKGREVAYLCDNARIHKSYRTLGLIRRLKINMMYIATCSPELNFVEQLIKVHKAMVNKKIRERR